MNYGNIKNTDIANGTGVRVSLFVSQTGQIHICALLSYDPAAPGAGCGLCYFSEIAFILS